MFRSSVIPEWHYGYHRFLYIVRFFIIRLQRSHIRLLAHQVLSVLLRPSRSLIRHLKVGITPWKPLSSIWGVWAMAAATGPLNGIFGGEPKPLVTFRLGFLLGSAGDGKGGDSAGCNQGSMAAVFGVGIPSLGVCGG